MRERPILFAAPMVRAILDGRKTQTRRVIKPPRDHEMPCDPLDESDIAELLAVCPYGQPGDRLWVRETWGYRGSSWSSERPEVQRHHIHYRADDSRRDFTRARDDDSGLPTCRPPRPGEDYVRDYYNGYLDRYWKAWRPSIHMPRWACRLVLEVTAVRVERLQAISETDAIAEGIERDPQHPELWQRGPLRRDVRPTPWTGFPRLAFQALWEGLHGTAGWDANPWVWVVEFRAVTP